MKEKHSKKRPGKYLPVNIVPVDDDGKMLDGFAGQAELSSRASDAQATNNDEVKITRSKDLPEESKIQVKMLMPDEKGLNLVRVNGSIKWVQQNKEKREKHLVMGVCFRDITPEDRKKLMGLWKRYG